MGRFAGQAVHVAGITSTHGTSTAHTRHVPDMSTLLSAGGWQHKLSPEEKTQGWRGTYEQLFEALGGNAALGILHTGQANTETTEERQKYSQDVAHLRHHLQHMHS
jgi:hypothetical protein